MAKKYSLRMLEAMDYEQYMKLINSVSDDDADDSEFGGDSDADDSSSLPRLKTTLPSEKTLPGNNAQEPEATPNTSQTSSSPQEESEINVTPRNQNKKQKTTSLSPKDLPAKEPDAIPSTSQITMNPVSLENTNLLSTTDLDSDDTDADPNYQPPDFSERNLIFVSETDSANSEDEVMISDKVGKHVGIPKFSKNVCTPKTFSKKTFCQPFGPKTEVDLKSPLNIFLQLMTIAFLKYIVDQSNLYASQRGQTLDLTVDELKAVFGILIIMGFHSLPSLRMYWSGDHNFHVPRIAKIMSLKRFLKIIRFIHLNDNSCMPNKDNPNFDRLYKIRPLIQHLSKTFKKAFNPSRYLSIDESMIGFKGRSSIKQYLPMKPIKRGFKVWVVACAVSGYMIGFQIYEGKTSTCIEGTLGERTVLSLAKSFEMLGYCLFFDRFFSSITLLRTLLQKGLFGCGTIMQNRKNFPKHLLKTDKELKFGDSDYAVCGEISVTKWKDRGLKSVVIVSNMHNPENSSTVERKDKCGNKQTVTCPTPVSDYNMYMGGVDRFDQLMQVYSISWKSRRWWMKIFYYLLDASIVNSYILYKETIKIVSTKEKPMSQLSFRSVLADELIGSFCSKTNKSSDISPVVFNKSKFAKTKLFGETKIHLTNVGVHVPVKGTMRRCAHCSTKSKPKRSSLVCKSCQVALCRDCFAPFHGQ